MVYSQGQELNVKFDVNIIVQFQPVKKDNYNYGTKETDDNNNIQYT